MHFLVGGRGGKTFQLFPPVLSPAQGGFLPQCYSASEHASLGYPTLGKGQSAEPRAIPGHAPFCLPQIGRRRKEKTQRPWRGHRGHGERFSQHSSAMTSRPDSRPSPRRAGQPGAGGAPLALAFHFACAGSSVLHVLGTRDMLCGHQRHALWTPASRQACKSEAMQCLSLPHLGLSEELLFYLPAPHPSVLMHL